MKPIPHIEGIDNTFALLSEGYEFIPSRCRAYRTDIFETRLMLQKVYCVTGEEAVRMFYTPDRFTRRRALPPTTLALLQDLGSVQLKEGDAHRHRKDMFLPLMTPENRQRLMETTATELRKFFLKWERMDHVVFHNEIEEVLCRAVCAWSGVPLSEADVRQRTREFSAMMDGAGSAGPRNWEGMLLRSRTERWARELIESIRAGRIPLHDEHAAYVIAHHREPNGEPLDTKVAAVELINVLRPTVAVARYITFAALALHQHPECRARLLAAEEDDLEHFVQEVRRFYPFFPAIGGRAKQAFDWRGHHFEQGAWVLLDVYGTLHDPRIWSEPEAFRPERFRDWNGSAYNLIPQGAGDHRNGHRCPGEWITIDLMKTAIPLLLHEVDYVVPKQDLHIDLSRMPAIPASRFLISKARLR